MSCGGLGEKMYILSNSLLLFEIKFVRKKDFPHSDGPVKIHLTG